MTMLWSSFGLFMAFLAVAAIDAAYFHDRRFQLWAHGESRFEHVLHTARAIVLPPTIAVLYLPSPSTLWIAISLIGLDTLAAGADVAVEWRSRNRFGGLPHGEYVTHVVATVLHVVAVTLAFVARSEVADRRSSSMTAIVIAIVVATSITAIHHLVLLVRGVRRAAEPPK